jgi:CheY-like chemotaxis protein
VTFAGALRALLRQDPDIIFVGEIRDLETAQTAVQAAMTGHLVLATLHTNDAISVVSRLTDIGLDRPSIAATLRGALAQRLLRRLCPQCAVAAVAPFTAEEQRLAAKYGHPPTMRAIGCGACNQTGYAGRVPVAEVVIATPKLSELIADHAPLLPLQRAAIAGGTRTLVETALTVVGDGRSTLHEVERVIGDPVQHDAPAAAPAAPAPERPSADVPVAPPTTERPSSYVRAIAEEATGDRPHVLIVDDDLLQRQLGRGLLEQHGFHVLENEDGADALERIHAGEEFDLIVLDLNMPRMDGREFLQRLRQSPSGATVPVIVLTGASEAAVEAAVMDDGADDYIKKPFDPVRFVARVKAALRRAGVFA